MFWPKIFLSFSWIFISSLCTSPVMLFMYGRSEFLSRLVKVWAYGVLFISGVRVNVVGAPMPTDRALLLFANHQSGFDLMVFSMVTPLRCTVVGKKELKNIPIIGWILAAAGAVLINRSDRASAMNDLNEAAKRVAKEKLAVAFAPEGTRNAEGDRLLPFKKGGFHLAVQGEFPIVPVVCSRLRTVVNFRERRLGPGEVTLKVLAPFETRGLTTTDIPQLMSRVYAIMQTTFEELSR